MPYARPSLSDLRTQVKNHIEGEQPGTDALLRFSPLKITGTAQAGLSHQHYAYLDYISKQSVPFSSTDEYLAGWAAFKGVYQEPAKQAAGAVTFSGTAGKVLPAGSSIVRGDGATYTTTSDATAGTDSTLTAPVIADPDPTGLTGAFGNTPLGSNMTLAQAADGIQSTGVVSTEIAGGADVEIDDSVRDRMLTAFQQAKLGGSKDDYETWALDVPGVTRAWCRRNGFGVGTVVVFVMMDAVRAAFGGFPQGSNGVASAEWRGIKATGDQLGVADVLYSPQSAVGLLYVAAPAAKPFNFTITGVPEALQDAATVALTNLFLAQGEPGGTIPFGTAYSAVATAAPGTYVVIAPTDDLVCAAGQLPVLGAISWPPGG